MRNYLSVFYQQAIDNLNKSGRPLEKDVANAIQTIKDIAEQNPDARWGREWRNSNKNMSLVIASNLKPVFERMFLKISDTDISALDFLPKFNEKSNSTEIQKLFFSFKNACRKCEQDSQESNIFNKLYGLFTVVFYNFEVRPKRKTKGGNSTYCIYCYREIWLNGDHRLGGDTCHVHSDLNRSLGKYHMADFQKFDQYVMKYRVTDSSIYKYQIHKLRKLDIPLWDTTQDQSEWLKDALKKIDACAPNKVAELSQSLSDDNPRQLNQENWPEQFCGTFFRYIAFDFATQRKPLKKVRDRLENIWEGNLLPEVAKKHNVSRQNLHQQLKKWTKVINDLRGMELSDEVIKFVFDFKFLPNRK